MEAPDATQGQTIASARRAVGLTQVQLGKEIGVTGRTISRWETGALSPSPSFSAGLASKLGIDDPNVSSVEEHAAKVLKLVAKQDGDALTEALLTSITNGYVRDAYAIEAAKEVAHRRGESWHSS